MSIKEKFKRVMVLSGLAREATPVAPKPKRQRVSKQLQQARDELAEARFLLWKSELSLEKFKAMQEGWYEDHPTTRRLRAEIVGLRAAVQAEAANADVAARPALEMAQEAGVVLPVGFKH